MLKPAPSQTPVKRLTMVERARLEALAAFGNEDFNSMSVKKDDFRSKLKSSATKSSSSTQSKTLTRLEKAKVEANSLFKNINFGQKSCNLKKRKFQESNEESQDPKKPSNLSRLVKAKAEVDKAFENVSLTAIPPKKSRIEREKMESCSTKKEPKKTMEKESQKVEWDSPRQPLLHPRLSNATDDISQKRLTRSQSANLKAKRSSEEKDQAKPNTPKSLKTLLSDNKQSPHVTSATACEDAVSGEKTDNTPSNHSKSLTRFEKAKLEALESFSGQHLEDICKQSTRIVAKYLKPQKQPGLKTEEEHPCVTPKQAPLSHKKEVRSAQPDISVYSSIIEGNFKDQISLLETSKRVVETAVMLETPEGSPMASQ